MLGRNIKNICDSYHSLVKKYSSYNNMTVGRY